MYYRGEFSIQSEELFFPIELFWGDNENIVLYIISSTRSVSREILGEGA